MDKSKVAELKSALEHSPDNPVLLKMYFNALFEYEEWEEAEIVADKIKETNIDFIVAKATVLLNLSKTSKGILFLEHVLHSGGQDPEVYYLVIQFYNEVGNIAQAKTLYRGLKNYYP